MSASDTPPKLYAAHEPIFPRRVSGVFRNLKWWIMAVTLGIYYLLPWVRWDRGASLSDQAVLIDLAHRRFFFFWIEIWPHEFYFIAGLLIMAGLGLFLFTSALGRVWCGYACPQTVWTDLFILVERWIDGDRNARVRLWNAKWDARKVRLRLTKWAVWLLIAVATGGAWVFYFTDAPTLAVNLLHGTAHPIAYTTIAILTLTTFVFGGFMREQICIYMCPWPRIQAAMTDEDTLMVAYRHWRGEPRGKLQKAAPEPDVDVAPQGDCIDCMACVNVCPVGIDIRDGQQLECITCALCIDACDEVMDRIGKPRGLIDYMALTDEIAEMAGKPPRSLWKHILRPRTILYSVLWSLVGFGLMFALFIRSDIDFVISPVRNPTYVTLSDGSIRNTYEVRLRNKLGDERGFQVSITSDADLTVQVDDRENNVVMVNPDETFMQRVHIVAPSGSAAAKTDSTPVRIWIEDTETLDRAYKDTIFNGNGK
ncbi:cytochrome c oxidase accessory protein CcoG [Falsihalocynthiibacter sp. S25ZX9]|uniref:cytochrome c oxidase accessory protein CcoG n=1 Tax=Falsihalocynthiibacter sp. S25ZX9 TaxID=3240870 RepID=UPI0035103652